MPNGSERERERELVSEVECVTFFGCFDLIFIDVILVGSLLLLLFSSSSSSLFPSFTLAVCCARSFLLHVLVLITYIVNGMLNANVDL